MWQNPKKMVDKETETQQAEWQEENDTKSTKKHTEEEEGGKENKTEEMPNMQTGTQNTKSENRKKSTG